MAGSVNRNSDDTSRHSRFLSCTVHARVYDLSNSECAINNFSLIIFVLLANDTRVEQSTSDATRTRGLVKNRDLDLAQ